MVDRLLALAAAREFRLITPHGVRAELQDPRTPADVSGPGLGTIFTIQTELVPQEERQLRALEEVMRGLARPGKHEADARHLFEAAKYCSYFITHDERLLKRADGLDEVLPPSLTIVTLASFLEIYDEWPKARTGSGSRHSPSKRGP